MYNKTKLSINLAIWNANGILHKSLELSHFLHRNNIDIALISETKIRDITKLNIPSYQIHRSPEKLSSNNAPYGGSMILIKNNIPHTRVSIDLPIQHTTIKLSNNIIITSLYNPPTNSLSPLFINKLLNLENQVIIGGDLNAKHPSWNCNSTNSSGNTIAQLVANNNNISVAYPDSPTRIPPTPQHFSNTLDIYILKNIRKYTPPLTSYDIHSDHLPVLLTIYPPAPITPKPATALNYKKTNWKLYKSHINEHLMINNKLDTTLQIDTEIKKITKIIHTALNSSTPLLPICFTPDPLPDHVLHLIKLRSILKRQDHSLSNTRNKSQINNITKEIHRNILKIKNEKLTTYLKNIQPNTEALWKLVKKLKNKTTSIPPLCHNNLTLHTPSQKAQAIASHFESVHHITHQPTDTHTEHIVTQSINRINNSYISPLDISLIKHKEITSVIKKFRNKKAPGPDGIPNLSLKHLPVKATIQLTYILNACLKLSYFPTAWKNATVIPIPKPGKHLNQISSYRPISLLNTISKILEKVILTRLHKHESLNHLLKPYQYGFRAQRSTVQQLLTLSDKIITNINNKTYTSMLLMDIEKAFDTVWQNALLHKLLTQNTPLYLIKIIQSYLHQRTFQVQIDSTLSSKKPIVAGVPQGGILSAFLFILYINDLPENKNTSLSLYADDTAIIANSKNHDLANKYIQDHVNQLTAYYNKWKIKINAAKTENIFFTNKHLTNENIAPVTIVNMKIEPKTHVKYLGLILDKKLSFTQQINAIKNKTATAKATLHTLLHRNSPITTENKTLIYKSVIRPQISYAAPIWYNLISQTKRKTLQVIQNNFLRLATNTHYNPQIKKLTHSNIQIHKITSTPTLQEHFSKLTLNFFTHKMSFPELQNLNCNNPLINKRAHPKKYPNHTLFNS